MPASRSKRRQEVKLTNQRKVFFPKVGFTKGGVVDYYRAVAAHILPHLANRPVSLVRFPDGVEGKSFYAKNAPSFTPDWVARHEVPRRHSKGKIEYILINDVDTLLWCANLAAIELHPFLHRVDNLDRPTSIVFDFDPGEGADLLTCIEVARLVKEILDKLGLAAFPKVTGSKGLQLYVPLNTAVTYEATGGFAKAVAELLGQRHPDLVVSRMAKRLREKRVMIDWSQNNAAKTTVSVYSLRAKGDEPFVSMPVEWKELAKAGKNRSTDGLKFSPEAALLRLRKGGDVFAPVLKLKQRLPDGFVDAPEPRRRRKGSSLREYERKRDFASTAEPRARAKSNKSNFKTAVDDGAARFVIQKHAARNLHYDLRLEFDGVLKSWAVPKGMPYDLQVKRSGFEVEDHPLEYLSFEGTIPKGNYGGGTVMVWDIGTYDLLAGTPEKGSMKVHLHGKKLRGEWRLYRIWNENGKSTWLIEKCTKAMKPVSKRSDDTSAISRRSMHRIASDNDAEWHGKDS